MIKNIWDKIKLAFERKPAGEILIPVAEPIAPIAPDNIVKPKRTRKPKNESA